MTEVLICCGLGGAGKTTTAAALGLGLALEGRRVVVLTIDPARRLADALGVELEGNTPQAVNLGGLAVPAGGGLFALMLDRKATWDGMVRRFAPSEEMAERLIDNRYYRAASTRLTGSHEYMAVELLQELIESAEWDVVVLDTPPAAHAEDFLRAPQRVRRLFDRRVMSVLTQPGRGLMGSATRRATALVQRLIGDHVLEEISEFFQLLSSISSSIADRNRAVDELLTSERTRFMLIASPAADAHGDALDFVAHLRERRMRFAGFAVNRVRSAPEPAADRDALSALRPASAPADWDRWADILATADATARTAAARDRAAVDELARRGRAPVWTLPEMPSGVTSVSALAALSALLPPHGAPARR